MDKNIQIVEHQSDKFIRINIDDINISEMTKIQKVTDVVALKVTQGTVKVLTKHMEEVETENLAKAGDYIVYNIGSSPDASSFIAQMLSCDKKVIKADDFQKLYSAHGVDVLIDNSDLQKIYDNLAEDNEDNSDFTDFNFVSSATRHEYIGRPVSVARVPFNFVISAPWGSDQFIKAGGYIIFNPNTTTEQMRDIYGTEGAHDREGGQLEKTYELADDKRKGLINDIYKNVIKADRSPIAGIQFNMKDLAQAYERVGKDLDERNLEKYL